MSGALMKAAMSLDDASLSLAAASILRVLAWDADENGECERSVKNLAKAAIVSERTCQTMLADLVRRNYLQIVATGGGRGHLSRFRVTLSTERVQTSHPLDETKSANVAPFEAERVQILHRKGANVAPFSDVKGANPARASVNKELIQRDTKRDTVANAPVSQSARAREHTDTSDAFERFWLRWPSGARKVNKKGAAALWRKKNLDAMEQIVMDGLDRWLTSYDWEKNDGEFIPNVTTWLNQDRFYAKPKAADDVTITNNHRPVTINEQKLKNTMTASAEFMRMVEKEKEHEHGDTTIQRPDGQSRSGVQSGQQRGQEVRLLAKTQKPE